MNFKDSVSGMSKANSIPPAAKVTTTQTGTAVDVTGAEAVELSAFYGDWTDGTFTPKVQEGAASDGSDAADVAAADLIGSFTALSGTGQENKLYTVGYKGTAKYVRLVITAAGTTTGASVCGFVTLRNKNRP